MAMFSLWIFVWSQSGNHPWENVLKNNNRPKKI
jgi:hypothetical protein